MVNEKSKYQIAYKGLGQGECHLSIAFDDDLWQQYEQSGLISGRGVVELGVVSGLSLIQIEAHISGQVELECDRCADPYIQPIETEAKLVVKISDQPGEYDGDIIWVSPSSGVVDLTQWIYETIILALPMQRVHSSIEQCNPEAVKYISLA